MIDDDLRALNAQASDHALDELEFDVWARLALRVRHRAAARRQASLQSAVLAISLIVSIAIGVHATRAVGVRSHPVVAFGLEFAPSSLLLSDAR